MAATRPVDIANMALALLLEAPIDTFDDDLKAARLLSQQWDVTREAELTKRVWSFAVFGADVTGVETADTEFPYAFQLPGDALRVLPVKDRHGRAMDYVLEGDKVMMRNSGTVRLRYVANLVDPGDWPATFTEVLSAALAVKVAHALTGKASMIEVAQNAYDRAWRSAARVDAQQRRGEGLDGTFALTRGDYSIRSGFRR